MNIAISGANGFIGKNLTLALSKNENLNLVYISRIKSNNNSNEYSFDSFFKGEINIKFDFFIHLASPNYDYCKDNSIKEGIENLTKNILLSLNQYDCKNFIFFSSCKVYGESSLSKTFFNDAMALSLNTVGDVTSIVCQAIACDTFGRNALSNGIKCLKPDSFNRRTPCHSSDSFSSPFTVEREINRLASRLIFFLLSI